MSDFGLIQITRQRIRPSVLNQMSVDNPLDKGSGKVLSTSTLLSNLETWISTFKTKSAYRALNIYLNPYLRAYLNQGILSRQLRWSWKFKLKIEFIEDETLSLDEFRVTVHNSDVDITTAVMTDQDIDTMIAAAAKGQDAVSIKEKAPEADYESDSRSNRSTSRPNNSRSNQSNYKDRSDRNDGNGHSRSNRSNDKRMPSDKRSKYYQ
jgi:ribonuclease G